MPVVVPLISAVVGGLVAYWLSGMRAQKEWRAKKRAEVLAELYRLLSPVEHTAEMATISGVPLEIRKQRIMANKKALEDMLVYFHAHALWIDAETLPDIPRFVEVLSSALGPYEAELNRGTPESPLAIAAAEHAQEAVSQAQEVLVHVQIG